MSTSNPYLFQQAQTATLGDEEMCIAFGKIGTPTINMTVADFLTWINNRNQWIYPTLLNGWANVSGNPVMYRKNFVGQLEIIGRCYKQITSNNESVFSLNSGYYSTVHPIVGCFRTAQPSTDGALTFAIVDNSGSGLLMADFPLSEIGNNKEIFFNCALPF